MDIKKGDAVTFEAYREQINFWYKANNIVREKSELYCDFLVSLLDLIDETYLGPDLISTHEDILNHFTWCFNKISSDFEKERIRFAPLSIANYDYLWYFIYKGYYTCDVTDKYDILSSYFRLLFDFTVMKSEPELESFLDFYKIFDMNLKKLN